jgi:GT2 family glycosyltransferase
VALDHRNGIVTGRAPLASIVISTYNRAGALPATLEALGRQTLSADRYEVIVVDDGSSDDTPAVLASAVTPFALRTVRHERNSGVSAGRNSGIRIAQGRYVIFVSDDVLVPEDFIERHVHTLERFPASWVVGGFRQLDSLRETPFGRYLDRLEQGFDEGRRERPIDDGLWEMSWPTARNLSLPRADLDRIGLFDERFRTCCEDQDLAQRAREAGIRFIYDESIDCLHNDRAADLRRYCNFSERGAYDTVLLCSMYPELHGSAPIVTVNGPLTRADGVRGGAKKLLKAALSRPWPDGVVHRAIRLAERVGLPDRLLDPPYRFAISLATFRGWRRGLKSAPAVRAAGHAAPEPVRVRY